MATPAAALPLPRGSVGFRDPTTAIVAAVALVALGVIPWAATGGPSALGLLVAPDRWPHYHAVLALGPLFIAALLTLGFGWLGVATVTALTAGIGLAWGFAQGFLA